MFKHQLLPAIVAVVGVAFPSALGAAPAPAGDWLVADRSAQIRIQSCNNALWGAVVWTDDPGKDENNPDPALRERSVIGMHVLLDMRQTGQNRWDGQVYNAENGRTYQSNISMVSDNVLQVEGCVLGGLFCGGENWTRATSQSAARRAAPSSPGDICP